MDGGPIRDINELLLNGFFKTARGKSPSRAPPPQTTTPSYLRTPHYEVPRERSRSRVRGPRGPPPPPPTVEDESVSVAKEYRGHVSTYDPPLRGVVEQNPIILEAEVTDAEAARLHKIPVGREKEDDNTERRFVIIPRSSTNSPDSDEDVERKKRERRKRDSGKSLPRDEPPKDQRKDQPASENRRTSRQDLPTLETKVPREIPPQYRRSTSAYTSTPKLDTLRNGAPRTTTGEYFLSPDVMRGNKESFTPSQSAPRFQAHETFGGRATPASEKRNSGSFSGSRPTTPSSDKRNSGNFELGRRSRRNSIEKLTRPQQLSEEHGRRSDKLSDRNSTARSSRSSTHSDRRYYSSSDDDTLNSDSDRQRRRRHRSNKLHPEDERHIRASSKVSNSQRPGKLTTRYTSPLPSPKVSPSQLPNADHFERSGTFPLSRREGSRPVSPNEKPRDKLNPFDPPPGVRPVSRQSSNSFPIPIPMPIPVSLSRPQDSSSTLPIPIPSRIDVQSPGESRRPAVPPYDDRGNGSQAEKPFWQPPKFQPPTHLEKPVGSYRRYSEDIERGAVTPLPTCPRKSYVRGRNDWLTLPRCPGFDICPSCYNSTMANTEFRNMFIAAPYRSPDTEILCDFGSSPWYRIAWLLTLKERRRDLNIFYGLAKVAENIPPCSGAHQSIRQWHSIIDPKTGRPISNFDVCFSCVKSIEVLLPSLRGVFVKTDVHLSSTIGRVCDLRFDSKRFVQYFDALETTADLALYNSSAPDTRNLATLVRRFSLIEECQRDIDLRDTRWHIITQLPEFTVCEECFEEVVWPELELRKAIPLMFNKSVQRIPKGSCQLYSAKMRDVFRQAVYANDYKLLASKARERKGVESSYKANLGELKRLSSGGLNGGPAWVRDEIQRIGDEWRKWE